jgi:sorbitol-specific phosphotransferase system component IIBC
MPQVFAGSRTEGPRRSRLAQFLGQLFAPRIAPGTYEPSFSLPALRSTGAPAPIAGGPAYASAAEARLAVCRRMRSATLWRRVRRGTWSSTSMAAARRALIERAQA